MNIRTHSDFAAFAAAYAPDVRRVAALSPRATVFQTWEWCAAWWRHRGGRGRRFLALEFVEGEIAVGFALLYRDPLTANLRPVGDGDADYADILAHPDHEEAVVRALAQWLCTDGGRFRLQYKQTPPQSVLRTHLPVLQGAAQSPVPGLQVAQLIGEVCPIAALPPTWDAYKSQFGKKRRAHFGYYERNLSKHFSDVQFAVSDAATLAEDTEAFFVLHQRRWNARYLPGAFADTSNRRFHFDMAQSLLAGGFLRLHTLSLNGRVEAALYCFHKGATTYYYLGGFEPEFARFSVGSVLTAQAIRYAIEADHATRFDFLRGNESYKYTFGAADVPNAFVIAGKRGAGMTIATIGARATLTAELRLKNMMHSTFGGAGLPAKGAGLSEKKETKHG